MNTENKQGGNNCHLCGKKANTEKSGWIEVTLVESDGFRLWEKPKAYRFESFNIPNKIKVSFCSKDCIYDYLKRSLSIFIQELTPPEERLGNFRTV